MPGAKEFRFQQAVMTDLKKDPDLFAWKTQFPPPGIPDIIVLGKGGLVALFECKSYNGTVSPRQKVTIERLRALGIRTEVVRTIDKVEETIKEERANDGIRRNDPI